MAVDMNFTWTDFEQLDEPAYAFVLGPRIGKTFNFRKPEQNLSVWAGGFRIALNSDDSGSLRLDDVFEFNGEFEQKIDNGLMRVEQKQIEVEEWWQSLTPPPPALNRPRYTALNRVLGAANNFLEQLNQAAIAQMATIRSANTQTSILISANLGPRDDAYAPGDQMTAEDAKDYHLAQISSLSKTALDVISGYTLAYPAEAIGIVNAAKQVGLPVVISFTVETDGKLPTGATMAEAIAQVDDATDGYAAYFMINCAHPDHFDSALQDAPWMRRIKGIVANASRCSHAELDEAEELDDGDPAELGQQMAALKTRFPHLQVLGGCCGTDMRHILEIAQQTGRIN